MIKKNKNLFVTFEGLEGSGKSTHIKKTASYLKKKGKNTVVFHEPGSTPLSEEIRDILLGYPGNINPQAELFLYLAARAQFVEEKLKPALKEYDIVISDRFSDSTLVYQGCGLKLGLEKIRPLVDFSADRIKPDLTFVLDVKPEIGLSRIKGEKDRIEKRDLTFHRALRKGYKTLEKKEPDRIKIIDSYDIEKTQKTIESIIEKYV